MTSSVRAGLIGAVVGGTAMFMLDPDRGARRRAVVRDKSAAVARKTRQAAGATGREVGNRLGGMRATLRERGRTGWSPGARLACGLAAAGTALACASLARRRRDDASRLEDTLEMLDEVAIGVLTVETVPADVLRDQGAL